MCPGGSRNDQVQKNAQHHFDRCGLAVEIALQGDVEILVLGSGLRIICSPAAFSSRTI
jgi:hypothetical protein